MLCLMFAHPHSEDAEVTHEDSIQTEQGGKTEVPTASNKKFDQTVSGG